MSVSFIIMEGNFMFTTSFWPAADSYNIHMMDIPLPDSLYTAVLDLIHQATPTCRCGKSYLSSCHENRHHIASVR